MTKQKFVVNGKSYEVEIGEQTGSVVSVVVDGETFSVEAPEMISKPVAVAAKPVAAVARPASTPAPVARPAASAAVMASGSSNEVVAPMPGTVLDILVKVGDQVTKGQEVVSLEAMKMRNAIRSTKDGVVSSINVSAGQKVKHNEVLVVID